MRTIILLKYARGRVSYLLFTELIRKVSESLCCQWTILMHCCVDILGHAGDRLFTDIVEKWLLNECRQCCDLLKNDHSLDAILNSFQITWTWDWKTIGWRLLTSGRLVQWNRSHFFQLLSRESNRLNGLFYSSTLFNICWTGATTLLINQCRTVGQQLHDRFILLYENTK